MLVSIPDPIFQTVLFTVFLVSTILLFCRRKKEPPGLSVEVSSELKGFAILAIVLAHIGYFLVNDTRFLFPLSVCAGVGVNAFLFLSGYGIAHSALHKELSPLQFYKKRLVRIFVPLWIFLLILFISDALFLRIGYSSLTIIQSFFGFFPHADVYQSANAPLWYLTMTLIYYTVFPFVFSKKFPLRSAFFLTIIAGIILEFLLPVSEGVRGLYAVHLFAFPIGVAYAGFLHGSQERIKKTAAVFNQSLSQNRMLKQVLIYTLLTLCVFLFGYTSLHSGVGKAGWIEEGISLLSLGCLIGFFILKPFQNKFLYWVGIYSYEIYLIHWPILYRYDFLYWFLPAGIATFVYLWAFLGIGWLFQKLTQRILNATRLS